MKFFFKRLYKSIYKLFDSSLSSKHMSPKKESISVYVFSSVFPNSKAMDDIFGLLESREDTVFQIDRTQKGTQDVC